MANLNSSKLKGTAALAQFLRDKQSSKHCLGPYGRYVLEQVDGGLVFRQPEADASVADAINELFGIQPPASRRIIKLR